MGGISTLDLVMDGPVRRGFEDVGRKKVLERFFSGGRFASRIFNS